MLRIISGKYGKRLIEQPDYDITRATSDKIRESIFSALHFEIEGKIILDLFSGSGSWSIEALSRGALKAISIEKNKAAFAVIQKNVSNLKITNVELHNYDALRYLQGAKGKKFDFIFMDPPFKEINLLNDSLKFIIENKNLATYGTIIVETDQPEKILIPKGLQVKKEKKYGKITILFLNEFF
ncbi:16S rRNA (guanine(966)-N(2))-methyltransferase RsmD [Mycoplasmopsis alligatoris]|uniref:RNA methyltransferase, RsmD family n=1 Tax=Mycoplasmopsis alligatoris A21JP2 TaxID=747682 RepID=D4XWB9_9BACT|nr:16S rRNA (guanine(966)-N(2))-methyltransferase RsmD [Mycoplasmopsis alligatoris]EFF41325.1 RNA methyltransferase, RsmD family [Mycoplasmopsis alligatoris A21JP2]